MRIVSVFEVTMKGVLGVDEGTSDADRESIFESALSTITKWLVDRAPAIDPIVSGSLVTGDLEVVVTVAAETSHEALAAGEAMLASAFEAALAEHEFNEPFVIDHAETQRVLADA